ncbi:MAG: FAD-dependent oxidoreductase [Planctomycetes bacterium]|nr:FAD-dependent oxidoreductase [Planctomycetota bacterium]
MPRTPLFGRLARLLHAHKASHRTGIPALELLDKRRRGFLASAGVAGAAAVVASCASGGAKPKPAPKPRADQPRIAVIGGGLAGLACAWHLHKQALACTVYEASSRTGGRVQSQTGLLGEGLTTELGGEFIDSGHADVLALCKELKLELLDMRADGGVRENAYVFEGRHFSEREVLDALKPLVLRLEADAKLLELEPDAARENPAFRELDVTSLDSYLANIGVTGWLRWLLEVAFVTEYGADAADQSALNLLSLLGTDTGASAWQPFGESDERFKVLGGNQRLADELAARLGNAVKTGHELISLAGDGPYRLAFDTNLGTREAEADVVVLALPFTTLREVELGVQLPSAKAFAIRELGYGRSGKLLLGMKSRPWRTQGFSGGVFSDEAFQLAWDNSRLQWGKGGASGGPAGITCFSGGKGTDSLKLGALGQQVQRMLPALERVFPGAKDAANNRAERVHWPSNIFARCGYACYRPGQWTNLRGTEGTPVGDLYFAGEHCSLNWQGYLNGAAETGRVAAEAIVAKLAE